jgi:hypothetical protein
LGYYYTCGVSFFSSSGIYFATIGFGYGTSAYFDLICYYCTYGSGFGYCYWIIIFYYYYCYANSDYLWIFSFIYSSYFLYFSSLSFSSLSLISITLLIISSSSSYSCFFYYSIYIDISNALLIIASSAFFSSSVISYTFCSKLSIPGLCVLYYFCYLWSAFASYLWNIANAYSLSSVFLFTISFLNAMKLSTAVIWSTIFLCKGFSLALSHASKN